MKAALARRTGRSEEELCFEERRRSARVAEEENLEESSLVLERSSRRARKEEPKLSDVRIAWVFLQYYKWIVSIFTSCLLQNESPNNASIPELERQIDKLTKVRVLHRHNVSCIHFHLYLDVFILNILTICGNLQRQAFFRKKLLQSSHTMRATLLGQDRYRRRYLVLPHLGGVLVEGPEELLSKSLN